MYMSIQRDVDIRCYKLDDNEKISKVQISDIENLDNESRYLIEMSFFGINHVYSLISFSKLKSFMDKISAIRIGEQMLSFTRVIGDSPILDGVNLKTRSIYLKELNYIEWISLNQLNLLINGINMICDTDITYDLQIGEYVDMPTIDFSNINFSDDSIDYKYIFKFKNDIYRFSNSIDNDTFIGIFVYIPEFNCWQYLSKKKFISLNSQNSIDITYAATDSPRCFSKVEYATSYSISDFESLLKYSIYIPLDIYFKKYFKESNGSISNKVYDAIEIVVNGDKYTTSVLMTHDELGIDTLPKRISNVLFMDNFCLLKLINNVICLKPY